MIRKAPNRIIVDYKEFRGEKQLKIQPKKQKFIPKLKKAEVWALALTLLFLALTAGYHVGLGRRMPDFQVETARDRASVPAAAMETAAAAAERVDINTATEEELKELSGVGDALAARIVAYREANGPFARVEDITLVRGIGSAVLEANRDRMTVGEVFSAEGEEEAA